MFAISVDGLEDTTMSTNDFELWHGSDTSFPALVSGQHKKLSQYGLHATISSTPKKIIDRDRYKLFHAALPA